MIGRTKYKYRNDKNSSGRSCMVFADYIVVMVLEVS